MRVRSSALFLLVALGSVFAIGGSAQAFLPLDARQSPPDFGRLDRARVPDPGRQAALTAGAPWLRFVAVHPGAWRVTWDDRAGTPRSILGARIPLGLAPTATSKTVEAASRALLAQMGPLVGVADSQLATKVVEKVHDRWFVQFDRVTSNGTPVLGAFASLQIENGDVVALRIETHPAAEANLAPAKTTASGAEAIVAASLAPWSISNPKSTARAVVAHVPYAGAWRYVRAFEVDTTAGPGKHWVSVVDATDGVILSRTDEILYSTAAVTGSVEPRTPVDTKVDLPLSFIDVTVAGNVSVADSAGTYTFAGASPASSSMILNGSLATVQDAGGNPDISVDFSSTSGGAFDWAVSGSVDQPQLDAYHSANVVRIWASHAYADPQDQPSGYTDWLSTPLGYNVNLAQTCNSYWDGSVNLFDGDSQCNNTAQLADVVFHETGHGLHNADIVTGFFDGALSEGTADFTSAQITGDAKIGPYFFTNGDPVRDLTQLVVYPQDLTGEVHNDGLTWGGSWWDLRTAMLAKYGAAGPAKVADLFVKSLQVGPSLDNAFDSVMQADTVGGSTPDQCEIISAFARHGLTSGSNLFALVHTEVASPATANQPISITATAPGSVCPALTVNGAALHYVVDGNLSGEQTVAMNVSGGTLTAQIPAQAAGHVVRYWFVETMQDGTSVTTPAGAPNDEGFGFYVGTLHTIWKDDFETDQNWTHGGSNDDWQRGAPIGSQNDPADAVSGANVLGNNLGGDYQPNSSNWAMSPVINCDGVKGARLEFRRWLSVEDATYDHARVEVSNGKKDGSGNLIWTELYGNPVGLGNGGALPRDPMWTFEDYDMSSIADGHKVQLRFSLTSDEGAQYGGWTLDDVAVVSPNAPSSGGGGGGCGCDLSRNEAQGLGSSLLLGGLALASLVVRKAKSRPRA